MRKRRMPGLASHRPPLAAMGGRARQRLIAVSPDRIEFDAQFEARSTIGAIREPS
jgi:hypothetical protein